MIRCRFHRRGLTLAHVLVALALLSAFSLAATELLRSTLRVSRDSNEMSGLSARFDAAVVQLRRDVWNAAKLKTPDERTARVENADGGIVTWAVTEQGGFVRTESVADKTDRQEWPAVAAGISFEIDGPVLLLAEAADGRGDGRKIPFVSQIALAREARP